MAAHPDAQAAGEREQGSEPSRIVFVIGTDKGAERHGFPRVNPISP
jgi:hypothetical protein